MRRIRRYLFLECLGPALTGLLIYTVLFLINLLFQMADLAIRKQVPLLVLAQFIALALPRLLLVTLPMAILLGILVGVSRLSADTEMTALRACGVSYNQMLPPLLGIGLLGASLAGFCGVYLLPEAAYAQHRLNAEILLSGDLARSIRPRVFYRDIPGLVLYADDADAHGILQDVILFQRDEAGLTQMTVAESLRIVQERETGNTRFFLRDGETHRLEPGSPDRYQRTGFQDHAFLRPPDEAILQFVDTLRGPLPRNERELPTLALVRKVQAGPLPGDGGEVRHIRAATELHRRLAVPPAALIFALLGLPLGAVTRRGGRSSGFAVSLGVVLAYWLLLSAGENLARSRAIPVWVAAWTPNLVFLVLGVGLTAWLVRDRRLPGWLRRLGSALLPRRSPRTAARTSGPPSGAGAGRWSGMLPERLDRYVLRHFVGLFLLVLASFYVFHFLADLRSLLDDITANEAVTARLVARYFLFATPGMLVTGMPLAGLLATLIAFGVLERSNEVTAMKAAGISLHRIALPVLLAGALLSTVHFAVSDSILPRANQTAAELRVEIRDTKPASTFGLRQWVFGSERRLYNFASYSPAQDEYQGVSIYRFGSERGPRLVERLEAERMRRAGDIWVLQNGWERSFRDGGEQFQRFVERELRVAEDAAYFRREVQSPAQMPFTELRAYIRDLRQAGYEVRELQVALHEKVAMAVVPLVLILLGLTFSFHRGRQRATLAGIGVAMVVAIAYYAFLAAFRALGGVGIVPPLLAAWSPGALFAALGAYRMISLPS